MAATPLSRVVDALRTLVPTTTARANPGFALAPEGAELLNTLKNEANASRETGLRIVIDPHHRSLSMSLAVQQLHDRVIGTGGSQVFLSAAAAQRLHGCTLRAGPASRGTAFYLDRPATAGSQPTPVG